MSDNNFQDWTEHGTVVTREQRDQRATRWPILNVLYSADDNCAHNIVGANGGGIRCTKCPAWFCF